MLTHSYPVYIAPRKCQLIYKLEIFVQFILRFGKCFYSLRLPHFCQCSYKMNTVHTMQCKSAWFITAVDSVFVSDIGLVISGPCSSRYKTPTARPSYRTLQDSLPSHCSLHYQKHPLSAPNNQTNWKIWLLFKHQTHTGSVIYNF